MITQSYGYSVIKFQFPVCVVIDNSFSFQPGSDLFLRTWFTHRSISLSVLSGGGNSVGKNSLWWVWVFQFPVPVFLSSNSPQLQDCVRSGEWLVIEADESHPLSVRMLTRPLESADGVGRVSVEQDHYSWSGPTPRQGRWKRQVVSVMK